LKVSPNPYTEKDTEKVDGGKEKEGGEVRSTKEANREGNS
jgi:hypothetical protein